MNITVPKNRKPKFELQLKILDLNNVPLVSGTSYVKWHVHGSNKAEHRGRTTKVIIREHKVIWDYEKTLPLRLIVDRNGMLQDSEIHFEVLQEYSSGARRETIILGNIKLNLAEFVEMRDDGEEGVARRYLMQASKINSTLKISIAMKHTEGDRNFIAPSLKTAPVFGGIAGIMTAERTDPDDIGHMPSMSSKTREIGKLQDMYRRTLAASWAAQAGELPADKCIEDIFSGGDGWGGARDTTPGMGMSGDYTEDTIYDLGTSGSRGYGHQRKPSSQGSNKTAKPMGASGHGRSASKADAGAGVSGRSSIEQQVRSGSADTRRRANTEGQRREIDEFTAREDLRSWAISSHA